MKNTEAEGEADGLLQTATAIREVRELCKLNKAQSNGNSLILFELVIKISLKFTVIISTKEPVLYEKHLGILLWLGRCVDIKVCKNFDPEGKLVKKDVSATTTVYVIGEVC